MKLKKPPDIQTIRRAVTMHRGGLDDASDQEIRIVWGSLDEQTRQAYLKKEAQGLESLGFAERSADAPGPETP